MDLKKVDLDKLQDYAFIPYEIAMTSMVLNQKFINIKCLDNEDIVPTVKAIPLDKIKQAREEIKGLSQFGLLIEKSEVLDIIDKLIESEEK